jgi:hypothetical protein
VDLLNINVGNVTDDINKHFYSSINQTIPFDYVSAIPPFRKSNINIAKMFTNLHKNLSEVNPKQPKIAPLVDFVVLPQKDMSYTDLLNVDCKAPAVIMRPYDAAENLYIANVCIQRHKHIHTIQQMRELLKAADMDLSCAINKFIDKDIDKDLGQLNDEDFSYDDPVSFIVQEEIRKNEDVRGMIKNRLQQIKAGINEDWFIGILSQMDDDYNKFTVLEQLSKQCDNRIQTIKMDLTVLQNTKEDVIVNIQKQLDVFRHESQLMNNLLDQIKSKTKDIVLNMRSFAEYDQNDINKNMAQLANVITANDAFIKN